MQKLLNTAGKPISAFAFGTMQFGGRADSAGSEAMFTACRDAGITHFDTAHTYNDGAAERLLGQFARSVRDDLFIATKAGYTGGSGAANLRAQVDESRARLGMDVIDLLYLHLWDAATPLDESLGALAQMQEAGIIRHIGVSNFAAWQVMKAQAVAARIGTRIDAIQPMYSLVKRQAEVEILPMAADQGIAVFPYSPLGGGLLTGKYAMGGAGRLTEDARYAARYADPRMQQAAEGLVAMGHAMGVEAATLAVAWVAAHPTVTAPIISARDADQLEPSLAALRQPMDGGLWREIAALMPAPPPATDRTEAP